MTKLKIIISPFCQTRDQKYCTAPLSNILPEIINNFHLAKKGYREGVLIVPVEPSTFKAAIVELSEGDQMFGSFKRRKDGEVPRKEIRVKNLVPLPVVAVDVVLYSNEVLALGNENSDLAADFEVITVLPKISNEDQPMMPETLMANHFQWKGNGGTNTEMDAQQFEKELRKSYLFWHNKAILE